MFLENIRKEYVVYASLSVLAAVALIAGMMMEEQETTYNNSQQAPVVYCSVFGNNGLCTEISATDEVK